MKSPACRCVRLTRRRALVGLPRLCASPPERTEEQSPLLVADEASEGLEGQFGEKQWRGNHGLVGNCVAGRASNVTDTDLVST